MNPKPTDWLTPALRHFQKREDLPEDLMRASLEGLTDPDLFPGDAMAWLAGLAVRGERSLDFVRGAQFLRQKMHRWHLDLPVVDVCGTGGDGAGTFNISTVVSWVLAASGLLVAKHGNRAQSGTSGSTDLLAHWRLGSPREENQARRVLEECGIIFCLAPRHHPILASLAPVRKRLGMRTLFNGLGPLCNPTCPQIQMIGLGFADWLEPYSEAVAQLGFRRALIVHGTDGLDELSLGAPNAVRLIQPEGIQTLTWTHTDFGLPSYSRERFRVGSVGESAAMAEEALSEHPSPFQDIVLANSGAMLWLAQRAKDLKQGVEMARSAIQQGLPKKLMDRYREMCPPI